MFSKRWWRTQRLIILSIKMQMNVTISKNGLFKEHKSVMYEIRLADSPNDTCPMEYEALQEIVTFD